MATLRIRGRTFYRPTGAGVYPSEAGVIDPLPLSATVNNDAVPNFSPDFGPTPTFDANGDLVLGPGEATVTITAREDPSDPPGDYRYEFLFWKIHGADEICLTRELRLRHGPNAFVAQGEVEFDRLRGVAGSPAVEVTAWYCPLPKELHVGHHAFFAFDLGTNARMVGLDPLLSYQGDPPAPPPGTENVHHYALAVDGPAPTSPTAIDPATVIGWFIHSRINWSHDVSAADPILVTLRDEIASGPFVWSFAGAARVVRGGVSRHHVLGNRVWLPVGLQQTLVGFYRSAVQGSARRGAGLRQQASGIAVPFSVPGPFTTDMADPIWHVQPLKALDFEVPSIASPPQPLDDDKIEIFEEGYYHITGVVSFVSNNGDPGWQQRLGRRIAAIRVDRGNSPSLHIGRVEATGCVGTEVHLAPSERWYLYAGDKLRLVVASTEWWGPHANPSPIMLRRLAAQGEGTITGPATAHHELNGVMTVALTGNVSGGSGHGSTLNLVLSQGSSWITEQQGALRVVAGTYKITAEVTFDVAGTANEGNLVHITLNVSGYPGQTVSDQICVSSTDEVNGTVSAVLNMVFSVQQDSLVSLGISHTAGVPIEAKTTSVRVWNFNVL